MEPKSILEIGALLVVAITIGAVVWERIATGKGIGIRAIQFTAVPTVLAFLLVLGLESLLDKSAIAVTIGAIVGYVFAKQGQDDKPPGG